MKTLLLSQIFPPQNGGSGRWFWEIYRRLQRDQFVIAVGLHPDAACFDATHELNIQRLPLAMSHWGVLSRQGITGYIRNVRAVGKLVKQHAVQQVHCGRCLPEGVICLALKKLLGLPYLCYVHGEDINTAQNSREYAFLVKRVLTNAKCCIANSQNTANLLSANWGLAEEKICVLHPGVDTQRFVPATRSASIRQRLGWNERRVILTVGRLQRRKGQDMMIRAIAELKDQLPDLLYCIIGDGEESQVLHQLVRELNVDKHVQFRGETTDRELIECYQQCDLFALPNREIDKDIEGFGMVLLEAQACGRPVLAGDSGGTAETMQIGITGCIADCTRPETLAVAVLDLMRSHDRLETMGTAARNWVVSHFDWQALALQAESVFNSLNKNSAFKDIRPIINVASNTAIDQLQHKVPTLAKSVANAVNSFHELEIAFTLRNPEGMSQSTTINQPITLAVPLPRGAVCAHDRWALSHDPTVLQHHVTDLWDDGSAKWVRVYFHSRMLAESSQGSLKLLKLRPENSEPESVTGTLRVHRSGSELTISTGSGTFHVSPGLAVLDRILVDEHAMLKDRLGMQLVAVDANQQKHLACFDTVKVEEAGRFRVTLLMTGQLKELGLDVTCRLTFHNQSNLVRIETSVTNPRAADHPGGYWDLGGNSSALIQDLALEWTSNLDDSPIIRYRCQPNSQDQSTTGRRLEIYQDSSGGEHWQSRNHLNRLGHVAVQFKGARINSVGDIGLVDRANPLVALTSNHGYTAVAIEEFWQKFPTAIEVLDQTISLRLWPQQSADSHELQGGERSTRVAWLDFGANSERPFENLSWVYSPSVAMVDATWLAESRVADFLPRNVSPQCDQSTDVHRQGLTNLLISLKGGEESTADNIAHILLAKREVIDEYGWRNYGDVWADHETVYAVDPKPVISHFNNQYDLLHGLLIQFLLTGDTKYWQLADPLARHIIDIDIYHTQHDKAAYNGGMFWHTAHYLDAGKSGHRSYSRSMKDKPISSLGGGPCNEHNYSSGLMLYYCLTGYSQARDAVIGLADWTIAMDDGQLHRLGAFSSRPTGLATCTRQLTFQGPGRGAGNTILALLNAWELTKQSKYQSKLCEFIHRTIHPADNIEAHALLQAEDRWSYTVYLQALAILIERVAYVDSFKDLAGYARACLLHYARWMVDHERLYLSCPEELEYPTETWAAQDLRKGVVLWMAASLADDPAECEAMRDKGKQILDGAWQSLLSAPSHQFTRPLAIILQQWYLEQGIAQRLSVADMRRSNALASDCNATDGVAAIGPPSWTAAARNEFTPQRTWVLQQLKSPISWLPMAIRLARPSNLRRLLSSPNGT